MANVFAIIALTGLAVTIASLVYLHLGRSGLDPLSSSVGEYGVSAIRWGYRAATIALGIAALALGVSLTAMLSEPSLIAFLFLLLAGIARFVISWAPTDARFAPRTATGRAHEVLAGVFFVAASVAAFLFSASFASDPLFAPLAGVSLTLAWLMGALGALTLLSRLVGVLQRVFGLAERLLFGTIILWMILPAATILAR